MTRRTLWSRHVPPMRAHDYTMGPDGHLVRVIRRRPTDVWIEEQRRESEEYRRTAEGGLNKDGGRDRRRA